MTIWIFSSPQDLKFLWQLNLGNQCLTSCPCRAGNRAGSRWPLQGPARHRQLGIWNFNPPFLLAPCMGNSAFGNLENLEAKFGLKVSQVWLKGMPTLKIGGDVKGLERGQRESCCGRALGVKTWVRALTPPLRQFLQILLASLSPSVTAGIRILTSQPSSTCSRAQQHLLGPLCEPGAGQVPGCRVNREAAVTPSRNLPTHERRLTANKQASKQVSSETLVDW